MVIITGPCFEATHDVVCSFGGVQVRGTVVDQMSAKCVAPFRGSLGKVDLGVSLDGGFTFPYTGKFIYGEYKESLHFYL